MSRLKHLLDQYQPSILIMEQFVKGSSRRSERIQLLAQTMRGFATSREMDTYIYQREKVNATVTGSDKGNRYGVALAVAAQLPILQHRLPDARRLWQSEDSRQSLFDAAALGLTHYALTRARP